MQTLFPSPAQGSAAGAAPAPYLEAYGDAQYVYTAGWFLLVVSLIGSLQMCIGPAILMGLALYTYRYAPRPFYRRIGIGVMAVAVIEATFLYLYPLYMMWAVGLTCLALSLIVFVKAGRILTVLRTEGTTDRDWQTTRNRARGGRILSLVAGSIGLAWAGFFILGVLVQLAAPTGTTR